MASADHHVGVPKAPGRHRARGRPALKGRQTDPEALADLRRLLGDLPRRADLLVEHLHAIQDGEGRLPRRALTALAHELGMALAEIYEVASFYHNFDISDAAEPAPVTVRICDSVVCEMYGADALKQAIEKAAGTGVKVKTAACMGRCDQAPVVRIGNHYTTEASAADVVERLTEAEPGRGLAPTAYPSIGDYEAAGGYAVLDRCRDGDLAVDEVLTCLEDAVLRGLGGAGFPTGRKWRFVRAEPGPRLMAVNADESEPGTFKDRHYLLTDPHRFLEGTLIAAHVVEAADVYIYLRDEYPDCRQALETAIAELVESGRELPTLHLRRGAGAYICGEESAMLESLEGKRGLPRHKPPFPSTVGLFGRPTLINNVETLYWVRDILDRGASWFADQGRHGGRGIRAYSVSGRVARPGVYVAPAGITLSELLAEHCGGMAPGERLKGFLPGGASGGLMPADKADLPLDFGSLEPHGGLIGSAAIVVFSDRDSAADIARNLMRFFADESCGQCTPCRAGTEKSVTLMTDHKWDGDLITELSACMSDASICGLGQAAPNAPLTVMRYFADDLKDTAS